MTHQFSLFGFQKPRAKVPISRERLEEAKRMVQQRNAKGAEAALREIREGLERFEQRLK